MTLYDARVRANRLGLHIYKIRKTRLKIKYRISNYYSKNLTELSKTITKLERQRRNEGMFSKLNGHRLKGGYKVVERKKRKRGRHPKRKRVINGRAQAEYERGIYKKAPVNGIIEKVMERGGIRCTIALKTFGSCNDIPLCVRRKRGIPFDEMADELGMSEQKLWDKLVYRR